MSLRKLQPLTFQSKGLSDSLDGTNTFPGAMQSLVNLVQSPGGSGSYVCRAASELQSSFPGFNAPTGITALSVQGTRIYGLVSTGRFPGHDEPFCFDMLGQAFVPISNVTAANTPVTQPTSGDWIPPTIYAVTNNRIIVTHPGFPGGLTGVYFGWFDVGGFTLTSLKGDTTSGSNVITSINDGFSSAPIIDGVQPGQAISGAGIPAGATVVSVANGTFDLASTCTTNGTVNVTAVGNLTGVLVGMLVSGPQFAAGTYVAALPGGSAVTLSVAALGSATGTAITFSGGGTITISANATATAGSVPLTLAGGTMAAPLWGAGNTNVNPLSAVPIAVSGFNGRAWYAVKNGVVFSDSLNPTNVTNASQALLLGDSLPVTALVGLPLTSQVTGGIIQSLIAFKGAQSFYQITGDAALSNLALSLVNGSVGTLAPNTICATPLGVAFVAVDGLRVLSLAGVVSEPIGRFGKGVAVPFINALYPSRMAAAYNQDILRISLQNGGASGQPFQEYWLEFESKVWTGPHSFPAQLIEAYTANRTGFVLAPVAQPAQLFFHTAIPQLASTYVENGAPLAWNWVSTLLPDNTQMTMNSMVETAVALVLAAGQSINFTVNDELANTLGTVTLIGPTSGASSPIWGTAIWGKFIWGGILGFLKQYRLPWTSQIVFKQATISASGQSLANFAIGNMYLGYQPLNYLLEDWVILPPPPNPFILDTSVLGGPDVLQ